MKGWRRTVAATALAVATVVARPAQAGFLEDAGWGSLTILANVGYMPAKLVYAMLGGLTGGMAFGLTGGDTATATNIWATSMEGTYVLTPPMLRGEEPIAFAGMPGGTAASSSASGDAETVNLEEQRLSHAN